MKKKNLPINWMETWKKSVAINCMEMFGLIIGFGLAALAIDELTSIFYEYYFLESDELERQQLMEKFKQQITQ